MISSLFSATPHLTGRLFLMICSFFYFSGQGQEIPLENTVVYQNPVYFEEKLITGAVDYQLQIATDSLMSSTSVIRSITNTIPAFWADGMTWGETYFWRVRAFNKDKQEVFLSKRHTFSLFKIRHQGFEEVKMDVKTNKEDKHGKGVIAVDYTKCVYDRQGRVVWTLPYMEGILNESMQIRDMKVTKDNTVTFLTVFNACEVDLQGNLLWKAPFPFVFGSDTVMYHHEFKKTNRGTYMVLGNRKVYRKILGNIPDEVIEKEMGIKMINGVLHKSVVVGMVLEFDKSGKLIWYWDANDYVTDEDMNFKKTRNGFPNFLTHDNALGENEEGTKVYVSFRDLSRIIKIDKKTKKVELSYGEKYPSGEAMYGNNLFKNQHDANVTRHNSIYILNNNGFWGGGISSVIELRDNIKSKKDTPMVWKFDLDFDTLTKGKSLNGGKINELPSSNLLVCAGELNRIFEVTKSKEIVWDAFIVSRVKGDSVWMRMPQYRANWVDQLRHYHFIPEISGQTNDQNKVKFKLTIHNTGNAEDSYEIELVSGSGALLTKVKAPDVAAGGQFPQMLNCKVPKGSDGKVYLVIKSIKGRIIKKMLTNSI